MDEAEGKVTKNTKETTTGNIKQGDEAGEDNDDETSFDDDLEDEDDDIERSIKDDVEQELQKDVKELVDEEVGHALQIQDEENEAENNDEFDNEVLSDDVNNSDGIDEEKMGKHAHKVILKPCLRFL